MFANYCIVNRQHYLKSRRDYYLKRYQDLAQVYREEYPDDNDLSEGAQLTPTDWGGIETDKLAIVNPFQDMDESGVDLRPLYASALWYLANVETIEALNALTYDVNKYGRSEWIIRQLQLMENKVRQNEQSLFTFLPRSCLHLPPALVSSPSSPACFLTPPFICILLFFAC